MLKMVYSIRHFFERHGFYVSSRLGDKIGIRAKSIRLFFIYSSFLAVGFPFIFYLLAVFVLDIRTYVKRIRTRMWDV
mgnify:CR=1 FL=1